MTRPTVGMGLATALGAMALAGPAAAGDQRPRFYYGELSDLSTGDLRMTISKGVANDMVLDGHARCESDDRERVKPVFGNRVISGFDRAPVEGGSVSSVQRFDRGLLPSARSLTGAVRPQSVEAEVLIDYQAPVESGDVADCSTGTIEAKLDRVTREGYKAIRRSSHIQPRAGR